MSDDRGESQPATAEDPADVDPDVIPEQTSPRWRAPSLGALVTAVAVGGVIGAEARYGVSVAVPHGPTGWPWSILLINVSGCLLIGGLMAVITELMEVHPLVRPLLGVGVLGGYTTFSTYTTDVLTLVQSGELLVAVGYVIATPVLAVLAASAGLSLARAVGPALLGRRGTGRAGRPA